MADFKLSRADMMESVRQGVADAIWRIATNGTDMPSADFYDAIKEGVAAMPQHPLGEAH